MKPIASRALQRGPDFLAGVLAEPLLAFGGSQEHVPRPGLLFTDRIARPASRGRPRAT
jgi:hypothetical protein